MLITGGGGRAALLRALPRAPGSPRVGHGRALMSWVWCVSGAGTGGSD